MRCRAVVVVLDAAGNDAAKAIEDQRASFDEGCDGRRVAGEFVTAVDESIVVQKLTAGAASAVGNGHSASASAVEGTVGDSLRDGGGHGDIGRRRHGAGSLVEPGRGDGAAGVGGQRAVCAGTGQSPEHG